MDKDYAMDLGFDKVELGPEYAPKMAQEHVDFFKSVYGDDWSQGDYDRMSVMYGQTCYDLLRLREKKFDSLPDIVLYPSESEQIVKTVAYCAEHKIPLYVYGGGSWSPTALSTRSRSMSTAAVPPSPGASSPSRAASPST